MCCVCCVVYVPIEHMEHPPSPTSEEDCAAEEEDGGGAVKEDEEDDELGSVSRMRCTNSRFSMQSLASTCRICNIVFNSRTLCRCSCWERSSALAAPVDDDVDDDDVDDDDVDDDDVLASHLPL